VSTHYSPAEREAHAIAIAERAAARAGVRREGGGAAEPPALERFVEQTTTFKLEPWQERICRRLSLLPHQTGQRILMHGPPQFGKSIIVSQRFPAWSLGVRPLSRIRLACYNLTHAERFSKVNLSIMRSDDYRKAFPSASARVPEKCPADEWSTRARAGLLDANPSFKALGLGSGFTGLGVDTLLIDDPYKNREEALSEATNANIRGWWADVVLPRLNPETNVVVMFHRWAEDDFAGFLMRTGEWEQYRFPAIADGAAHPAPDAMGREAGEPLSPRFPAEYLEKIRSEQGLSFYALYQGTPLPPGGEMFKREWFKPAEALPADCSFVRYWDKAGTEGGGAFTAGVLMGRSGGVYYVADVVRGQWSAGNREAKIKETAAADRRKFGHVSVWVEQEPGSGGKESAQNTIMNLAGYPVRAEPVTGSKQERADPFAAQAEAGNVRILEGEWNAAYLSELTAFPLGKYKDQVDASSGAFNKLALVGEVEELDELSDELSAYTGK